MEAITEDLLQTSCCFTMNSQVICLSVHSLHLCIRSDEPIAVDKRSDIWKTWPNVYLMRLTVTLFNSLLSMEWFFLGTSQTCQRVNPDLMESEWCVCVFFVGFFFWAPWPWNDVPTVSISPGMDLEPQQYGVSQDTTNEATRETEREKESWPCLTQTHQSTAYTYERLSL